MLEHIHRAEGILAFSSPSVPQPCILLFFRAIVRMMWWLGDLDYESTRYQIRKTYICGADYPICNVAYVSIAMWNGYARLLTKISNQNRPVAIVKIVQ